MDYSLNQKSLSPRQYRKADNLSQISGYTPNSSVQLKPIDLVCNMHPDEPCNNYCVQFQCFQQLCSECIEDHLLHHKKHGYSDLSVKSMRTVRKDCIVKLAALIQQLMRIMQQLEAPPSPEKIIQQLDIKLQQALKEAHDIVDQEFARVRETLRSRVNQSVVVLKGMADIHLKLQNIIQQLKETSIIISEGKKGGPSVPQSIKSTITLNQSNLIENFEREGLAYESKRKKIGLQIFFNSQLFRSTLLECLKMGSKQTNNDTSFSRPKYKNNYAEQSNEWDSSASLQLSLPIQAEPQEVNKIMHFFETGSSKLHLIEAQSKKKAFKKIVTISQFIVPSFHASIMSQTGDYIYLSGGLVQLNGRSKSPLFMRYNIRTEVTKKDFAKVIPRSSHSLCQDKNGDIYILGGYGQASHEEESVYLNVVERISERTGKVQIEADSNWGGSNISFRCRQFIVKSCSEGVELYNPKFKQWVIADIRMRSKGEFIFYRNAGFANLSDNDIVVYGGYSNGYDNQLKASDKCFYWKLISEGGNHVINVKQLPSKLPTSEGFDNGKAVVDERGFYALQNIEDDEQSCIDSERRLLRFDLKDGEGQWRVIQVVNH